jgi:hypothetical protein
MICARPYCENKEDRINGYCSCYCENVHELQVEAETLLAEKKIFQDETELLQQALEKVEQGEWRADGWEAYANLKAIAHLELRAHYARTLRGLLRPGGNPVVTETPKKGARAHE